MITLKPIHAGEVKHVQHLLLRLDELAGEASYEVLAPFLRHFRMIISKLGCCCSHPEGAQTLSAALCKWDSSPYSPALLRHCCYF